MDNFSFQCIQFWSTFFKAIQNNRSNFSTRKFNLKKQLPPLNIIMNLLSVVYCNNNLIAYGEQAIHKNHVL